MRYASGKMALCTNDPSPWRTQLIGALSDGASGGAAVTDADNSLTLPELQGAASWVARQLWAACDQLPASQDSATLSSGHTAALFLDKSVLCVISSLGSLMAGIRFVDVPGSARAEEVVRILRIVQPTFVLTTEALKGRVPTAFLGEPIIILIDDAINKLLKHRRCLFEAILKLPAAARRCKLFSKYY